MKAVSRTAARIAAMGLFALAANTAQAQVGKSQGIIYPDIASEAELAALPNMTPALAKWIVDNRPFTGMKQIDDHLRMSLDSTKRNELYRRMFLPTNLNVQVPEEIALIPHTFRRMAHEFDEYKPYAALAVWYREIDKYIDEPLLSTIAQYIFVPINANSATDENLMTIPGLKPAGLAAIKSGRPFANEAAFLTAFARTSDQKEAKRVARYLVFTIR